jgi:hypothetical protein
MGKHNRAREALTRAVNNAIAAGSPVFVEQRCKLDHSAGLPEFLCRVCHPELNTTPEERAAADERDKTLRHAEAEALARKRELENAERKLATLRKRNPEEGTVSATIAQSLERKIERIKSGGPSKLRKRHHISSNRKQSPIAVRRKGKRNGGLSKAAL